MLKTILFSLVVICLLVAKPAYACCSKCDCFADTYSFLSKGKEIEVLERKIEEYIPSVSKPDYVSVCNRITSKPIWISIAYVDAAPAWRAVGWFKIGGRECRELYWAGFTQTLFIHVFSSNESEDDRVDVCIDEDESFAFDIKYEHRCLKSHYKYKSFKAWHPKVENNRLVVSLDSY